MSVSLPDKEGDEEIPPPLTGLSAGLDRVLMAPTAVLAIGGAVALLAMMLVTVIDVLYRVLLTGAIPNAQLMISHWFLSGLIFLPLAYVTALDRHISVEVLSRWLPERAQELMMGVFLLVGAAVFMLLAIESFELAMAKYRIGEYLSGTVTFHAWPGRFLMPIGTSLFAVILAARGIGYATGRIRF